MNVKTLGSRPDSIMRKGRKSACLAVARGSPLLSHEMTHIVNVSAGDNEATVLDERRTENGIMGRASARGILYAYKSEPLVSKMTNEILETAGIMD